MEKSFPFNSINGDRRYKADDWRDKFATLIGNGVFPNPSTNLQVISNNDMTISVAEGKGWINGAIYNNTDNLVLSIDPADGTLNRIDRVVMRFDNLERNIKCKVKKGTFASTPISPSLQRDADAYELCIAEIRIDKGITSILQSKITDTRLNSEICGIVTQMINTIDTSTLFTKLEAYIDERGQDVNGWIDEATTRWEVEFISWFNTIKDILDGDIAGALAARIAKLEETVNNLELTSTKVMRPNQKTVEQSLSDNETSILNQGKEIENLKQSVSSGKSVVASAITDKGIPTLATDTFQTMATNIGEIATGLEIKHCTTLPLIVKNDDFYVLSNTPVNNIYIKHYEGENSSLANAGDYQDGDVVVLFDKTINGLTKIFDFTSKNTRTILNVMKVLQVINNKYVQVEVYEGINGKWEQVVNKEYTVFSHGIYMQELETGQIDVVDVTGHNGDNSMSNIDRYHRLHVKNIDGALEVSVDKYITTSYGYLYKSYHTSKGIDFTPYRRLVVEFEKVKQNNSADEMCSMSIGIRDTVNNSSLNISSTVKGNIAMGNHTIDLDISNYAKIGRLVFRLYIEGGISYIPGFVCNIKKITLLT